jgi:hypothetical protein
LAVLYITISTRWLSNRNICTLSPLSPLASPCGRRKGGRPTGLFYPRISRPEGAKYGGLQADVSCIYTLSNPKVPYLGPAFTMYSHPAGSSFEFSSLSIPLRGMSAQRPSAQGLGAGRGKLADTRPARRYTGTAKGEDQRQHRNRLHEPIQNSHRASTELFAPRKRTVHT